MKVIIRNMTNSMSSCKFFILTLFMLILCCNAFAQYGVIRPHAKKDSAWLNNLLLKINTHPVTAKDSTVNYVKWQKGKIYYSPDSLLRVAQFIGGLDDRNAAFYTAVIQYKYENRVIEREFDDNDANFDFRNYPITHVYKLPGKLPSYLILSREIEMVGDDHSDHIAEFTASANRASTIDFTQVKSITNAVSTIRLGKDSLIEVAFPPDIDETDDYSQSQQDTSNGKSFTFISDIKQGKRYPRPFLKYNPVSHQLSFQDIDCKNDSYGDDSTNPYLSVDAGTYEYRDTSFVLIKDTSYYYPALASIKIIVAKQNYKVGPYLIKAKAIKGYKEVGEGILPILTTEYKINSKTITSENYESEATADLKPDCKLQKNFSLIVLSTDITTPNHRGQCGGADYEDSHFTLVTKNTSKSIFSFSSSSCDTYTTYSYRDGKTEKTGKLYLTSPAVEDENAEVERSYWKDASTYVFQVTGDSTARNFYVYFDSRNPNSPVRLTAGKLYSYKKTGSR